MATGVQLFVTLAAVDRQGSAVKTARSLPDPCCFSAIMHPMVIWGRSSKRLSVAPVPFHSRVFARSDAGLHKTLIHKHQISRLDGIKNLGSFAMQVLRCPCSRAGDSLHDVTSEETFYRSAARAGRHIPIESIIKPFVQPDGVRRMRHLYIFHDARGSYNATVSQSTLL